MKINDFVKIVRKAKHSSIQTGGFNMKVRTNKERTAQFIYDQNDVKTCRLCVVCLEKGIRRPDRANIR